MVEAAEAEALGAGAAGHVDVAGGQGWGGQLAAGPAACGFEIM